MSEHGQLSNDHAGVLRWPGRVVAAEALRRSLNGHRRLLVPQRSIITPSAAEELKARGVQVDFESAAPQTQPSARWGFGQDRQHGMVASALTALRRDGIVLHELPGCSGPTCDWARVIADCVARGDCCGGVVFSADPGLICCVANKVPGLRAVPVVTVDQAARATLGLGANVLVVEMPGRTFFEVRQILRLCCTPGSPHCPEGVACVLQELDGHAHR